MRKTNLKIQMLAGKNLNSCPDPDSDETSTLVTHTTDFSTCILLASFHCLAKVNVPDFVFERKFTKNLKSTKNFSTIFN